MRPTNHFRPHKREKNGTAQRPSLSGMNEFLIERVAKARPLQATPFQRSSRFPDISYRLARQSSATSSAPMR